MRLCYDAMSSAVPWRGGARGELFCSLARAVVYEMLIRCYGADAEGCIEVELFKV